MTSLVFGECVGSVVAQPLRWGIEPYSVNKLGGTRVQSTNPWSPVDYGNGNP